MHVKMKFHKPFVITNGIGFPKEIGKPIILDFHKFGQSSHFGAKRLAIRKKENQCKQSDSFTNLYVGTGQKENPYPFTNGNSYDVKYHMDDLNASENGQENTIRRIQSAGKRAYMEFWK